MIVIYKCGRGAVVVAAGHVKHLSVVPQCISVADPYLCRPLHKAHLAGIYQQLPVRALRLSSVHPQKSGTLILT